MSPPQRTCIGCRVTTDAADLVRVTRAPDGSLRLGAGVGRGAWLHRDRDCLDRAAKKAAFGKALRSPVGEGDVGALRVALDL